MRFASLPFAPRGVLTEVSRISIRPDKPPPPTPRPAVKTSGPHEPLLARHGWGKGRGLGSGGNLIGFAITVLSDGVA
jgi:hypothetical protein